MALQAAAEAPGKVKIVESAAVYQLEQGGISKDNHNGSQPDQVPSTRGPLWAVSYKELNHRLDSPEPSSSFTVPSSRSGNNSQSSGDNSGQCSSSSVTVAVKHSFFNAPPASSQPLPQLSQEEPRSLGQSSPGTFSYNSSRNGATVPLPIMPVIGKMFRTTPAPRGTLKHIVCGSESDFHWSSHPATSPPCATHLRQRSSSTPRSTADGGAVSGGSGGASASAGSSTNASIRQDERNDGNQGWAPRLTRHLYGRQTSDGRLIWGGDRRVRSLLDLTIFLAATKRILLYFPSN